MSEIKCHCPSSAQQKMLKRFAQNCTLKILQLYQTISPKCRLKRNLSDSTILFRFIQRLHTLQIFSRNLMDFTFKFEVGVMVLEHAKYIMNNFMHNVLVPYWKSNLHMNLHDTGK